MNTLRGAMATVKGHQSDTCLEDEFFFGIKSDLHSSSVWGRHPMRRQITMKPQSIAARLPSLILGVDYIRSL
jgi:hypothetical protein